jgi:hypothetical protein
MLRRFSLLFAAGLVAVASCGDDDAPAGGAAGSGGGGAADAGPDASSGAGGLAGAAGSAGEGGSQAGAAGIGQGGAQGGGAGTGQGGTAGGAAAGQGGTAGAAGTGACLGSKLMAHLGSDTLVIGGAMETATAGKAPFDARYQYLAGGLFDSPSPCVSCATNCTSGGTACDNNHGCDWWGCWQWDQDPPGMFATNFITANEGAQWQGVARPQIPWFTYYEQLHSSGLQEGTAQLAALNNTAVLTRYLADWRFLLQKVGNHKVLLHIEPDMWGYVEQLNADPHAVPAAVPAANPTDCPSHESSAAGLARCMVHMVRKYSPQARVGLHASAWGTKFDVFGNSDPTLNVAGEAQKLVAFFTELGAKDGDFIVADPSDRDAGYYESIGRDSWWDDTNATIPNFAQAFTWTKLVAEGLQLPVFFWQIPVGHMGLSDTNDHWKDNRVDYFFAHTDEVVAAHIVGLLFGAGMGGMTTPETDGGNFVTRTVAYRNAGGTKICPN